ncbi:MAG: S8 family serine peptidase [Clostridia bacterium]
MKIIFRKAIICLVILSLTCSASYVFAGGSDFEINNYYWLYSSAIPAAWKEIASYETSPVLVAVIDTGIEIDNPHLAGRIDSRGRNFTLSGEQADFNDIEGHGTAVSGIIAALPTEEKKYVGAAGTLDITILPLKIYNDRTASTDLPYITNAIYYAIELGADIINISIDVPVYSEALEKACLFAYQNGIIVVAPSGNKGNEYYAFPASCSGVISVGSLSLYNPGYYLSSPFSSFNDKVDICAEGEDIYTIGLDGTYKYMSGTSFACAIVTGAIAVMKAINSDLTPFEAEAILKASADKLSDTGRNNYYGYGRLDLLSAINTDIEDLIYQSFTVDEEQPADTAEEEPFTFEYRDLKNTMAVGLSFGVWLDGNSNAKSVGDDSFGKADVSTWGNLTGITTGDSFTIGITAEGKTIYTGYADSFALNTAHWSSIKYISSGSYHTVGVTTIGTLVSAGSNSMGQCDVSVVAGVKSVDCGALHTACLRSNGTVRCVGSNFFGESNTSLWSNIVSVAAGNGFTLGLKSDGTVVATGNNTFRQTDVSSWTHIIEVFAGPDYSIGLRSDGTLVYTGIKSDISETVSTLTDVSAIACGTDFMIVETNDGIVKIIGNVYAETRSTNEIYLYDFTDTDDTYWAYEYISTMGRLGIVNGMYIGESAVFMPYEYITRQQFLKIIIKATGISSENIDTDLSAFVDVADIDEWSLPYIKAAYRYGFLKGSDDGQGNLYIYPDNNITRAEAMVIIGRAFGISGFTPAQYSDNSEIPSWAFDALSYYTQAEVMNGYPDGTIKPYTYLSRAETSVIIYRLFTKVINTYEKDITE